MRLRGPLGVDGKPEEASVLKAIRAAVTFCVEIKLSQQDDGVAARAGLPWTRCRRLSDVHWLISTQLTLAKNKMSIPCDHLWLAFCVCDRWVGLKEGECLLAGGEYRGKLLDWRCASRRRQKINGGIVAAGRPGL